MMTKAQLRADLRMYLIQIPVSLCFGTFIDISMTSLSWLNPATYPMQLLSMLAGCVILACGITLEVKADVAMVAGEFFVRVLARRINGDFGYVKLGFDVGNVIVACVFSMLFIGGIHGVREGTVAAALLVGPIVHFLTPFCRVLNGVLGYSETAAEEQKSRPSMLSLPLRASLAAAATCWARCLPQSSVLNSTTASSSRWRQRAAASTRTT